MRPARTLFRPERRPRNSFQVFSSNFLAVDQAGTSYVSPDGVAVVKAAPGCNNFSCTTPVANIGIPLRGLALDRLGNLFIETQSSIVEVPPGCTSAACQFTVLNQAAPTSIAVNDKEQIFFTTSNGQLLVIQLISADFFNVNVGSSSMLTLNYNISSAVTLAASPGVVTQGTPGLDFTLGNNTCIGFQAAGNSCSVTVSFSPLAPGLRMGAVQLTDSSGNLLLTTPLRGVGMGPAIAFPGGVQTPVGQSNPTAVAVDAAGNVFIAEANTDVLKVPAGCTSSACQSLVVPNVGSAATALAVDGAGNLVIAGQGGQ